MKTNTKRLIGIGIVAVLLLCTVLYFRYLSLLDIADEGMQMQIILNEYSIENGEPNIDTVEYQNITEEQHQEIISLFDKYPYQRTLGTLFSDDTLYGLGNKILYIHMNGAIVTVTSTGKLAINDKTYRMDNAEQFIHQIIDIVE